MPTILENARKILGKIQQYAAAKQQNGGDWRTRNPDVSSFQHQCDKLQIQYEEFYNEYEEAKSALEDTLDGNQYELKEKWKHIENEGMDLISIETSDRAKNAFLNSLSAEQKELFNSINDIEEQMGALDDKILGFSNTMNSVIIVQQPSDIRELEEKSYTMALAAILNAASRGAAGNSLYGCNINSPHLKVTFNDDDKQVLCESRFDHEKPLEQDHLEKMNNALAQDNLVDKGLSDPENWSRVKTPKGIQYAITSDPNANLTFLIVNLLSRMPEVGCSHYLVDDDGKEVSEETGSALLYNNPDLTLKPRIRFNAAAAQIVMEMLGVDMRKIKDAQDIAR